MTWPTKRRREHAEAKQLIGRIKRTDDAGHLGALVSELERAIQHRVSDEETEVFPKVHEDLGADRINQLGDAIEARKKALKAAERTRKRVGRVREASDPGAASHACQPGQGPASSPTSSNAVRKAARRRRAVRGARCATSPAPGRSISSTVSSMRTSLHSSQSSSAATAHASLVRSGSPAGWSSSP